MEWLELAHIKIEGSVGELSLVMCFNFEGLVFLFGLYVAQSMGLDLVKDRVCSVNAVKLRRMRVKLFHELCSFGDDLIPVLGVYINLDLATCDLLARERNSLPLSQSC